MTRISLNDISPDDDVEYPSVPWPAGRKIADGDTPDRSTGGEDDDGDDVTVPERALAHYATGIPRRRDHI